MLKNRFREIVDIIRKNINPSKDLDNHLDPSISGFYCVYHQLFFWFPAYFSSASLVNTSTSQTFSV